MEKQQERALLIGLNITTNVKKIDDIDINESMEELKELAKAAGAEVVGSLIQNRPAIDAAYYVGKGKVEELRAYCEATDATMVIFNDELSGAHIRNLEEAVGRKVIDRTTLILDIFAQRALSKEGKLQVELAQLRYRMPRLYGMGGEMSRTGAGIGTRGPGEQKLEIDKRIILNKIADIRKELKEVSKNRETQRVQRMKSNIPIVALVGYTNAGKSTLRNALCDVAAQKEVVGKEKVFEADMLFATLDITTRAIVLKNKGVITLTDTVGFVRKLPHDLVEAFKSTLEEVIYSDLLCHVVDTSSDTALEQIRAVEEVLAELGAKDKKTLLVLNKIDKATEEQIEAIKEATAEYDTIEISAREGINLEELLMLIEENLPYKMKKCEYLIPYDRSDMNSFLHRNGRVLEEEYRDDGTFMIVEVDDESYNKSKDYIINIIM